MFHLGGTDFPRSSAALEQAVRTGLEMLFTLPTGGRVVDVESSDTPLLYSRVKIDLTGARLIDGPLPPPPKGVGPTEPAGHVTALSIDANSLYLRGAPVRVSLTARDAKFDFDRDTEGHPLLILTDASDGKLMAEIGKEALNALILAGAKEGAAAHGVQIVQSQVDLTQAGPRTVLANVRVKAKKMLLSAVVLLHGKLSIDDNLNASVSDLTITGEGMLGEMAAGALRPQLAKVSGMSYPLSMLPLGRLAIKDVAVDVSNGLRLNAAFGG